MRALIAVAVLAACDSSAALVADAPGAIDAIDASADAPLDAPADAAITSRVKLADTIVEAPGASGTGFGDPAFATNGVRGGGATAGSFDVYSLNYTTSDHVTLRWSAQRLRNGPGADVAVFENAFRVGAGMFMDLIIVEVSLDGVDYRALPHRYANPDPAVYRNDPALWVGFAGRTPVLLNADANPVDPFDATAAGGDAFDLDSVAGDDDVARNIRRDGARFIRLVSASARTNPDTNAPYVHDSIANGPDIDGVYGRYVEAE